MNIAFASYSNIFSESVISFFGGVYNEDRMKSVKWSPVSGNVYSLVKSIIRWRIQTDTKNGRYQSQFSNIYVWLVIHNLITGSVYTGLVHGLANTSQRVRAAIGNKPPYECVLFTDKGHPKTNTVWRSWLSHRTCKKQTFWSLTSRH